MTPEGGMQTWMLRLKLIRLRAERAAAQRACELGIPAKPGQMSPRWRMSLLDCQISDVLDILEARSRPSA